jgi:antitoxin Phd
METIWKLQDAKAKFSKIVDNAMKTGPQFVTRRGEKAVVIVSVEDYEEFVSNKPSFKDFLLNCPKFEIDLERNKDLARSIEF